MTVNIKKTKTGWKFKIAAVTARNVVVHMDILCSRRPNLVEAEKAAYEHIKTHLLSFNRFPSYTDMKTLPILF